MNRLSWFPRPDYHAFLSCSYLKFILGQFLNFKAIILILDCDKCGDHLSRGKIQFWIDCACPHIQIFFAFLSYWFRKMISGQRCSWNAFIIVNLIGGKGVVRYESCRMQGLWKLMYELVQVVAISEGNKSLKHKILVYDVIYDAMEYKLWCHRSWYVMS